jgi:hypothetical protein
MKGSGGLKWFSRGVSRFFQNAFPGQGSGQRIEIGKLPILSEPLRHAALRAMLRRTLPAESAPGK